MKNKWPILGSLFFVPMTILAITGAEGPSSPYWVIESWDTDNDGFVEVGEAYTVIPATNLFNAYDDDNNDLVSEKEFEEEIFKAFNDDYTGVVATDDVLTREEFNDEIVYWEADAGSKDFDVWDLDGNGLISYQEFETNYNLLDQEAPYTPSDFNEAIVTVWDTDGDGMLSDEEISSVVVQF